MRTGCTNRNLSEVHVRDVRGGVGDDLVALNAYDWLNSSINFGPQRNILCEDLELVGGGYPAIRIQPAKYRYADGAVVDCAVSNVIFRRVKGITTFKMYLQTPRYRIGTEPEWAAVGTGATSSSRTSRSTSRARSTAWGSTATRSRCAGTSGPSSSARTCRPSTSEHRHHVPPRPLPAFAPRGGGPEVLLLSGEGRRGGHGDLRPLRLLPRRRGDGRGLKVRGAAPQELVRATAFDDVNRDGRSSGRGVIDRLRIVRD